ncbi:SMI1/KNR4 family protein [Gorillibacterium sp. CAU 1737]|uniref:SMI1/KNR4 family protein n=1 Tax=Gorillibacterium sp. CAU 1737 TaxID=3140362 RepID=UPI003261BE04
MTTEKNNSYEEQHHRMADMNSIVQKIKQTLLSDGMDTTEVDEAFAEAKLNDLTILTDLYGTFREGFVNDNDANLENLKKYSVPEGVVDFYRNFEPNSLPPLSGGVVLLGLEAIKGENSTASPSMYLLKHGLLTFATTIGGHVIGMDLKDMQNNEPRVVIADYSFCSYNEDLQVVECVHVPDEVANYYSDDEPIVLSYDVIKECLPQVAASFSTFLIKLADEEFENIEREYLVG